VDLLIDFRFAVNVIEHVVAYNRTECSLDLSTIQNEHGWRMNDETRAMRSRTEDM